MAEDVPFSPPLIPLLPDEISIICIARVHVTSHTAIAQVSRSWRSFVRSPSFFSVRSELAVTELVLTVCIENESKIRNRWYHLHPYQTPFPLPQSEEQEHDEGFACASLGPHLFRIGGISSSHSLKIYDGCLRRWSHGPTTSTSRVYAAAGVAGGRIHVFNHDIHMLNHDDISPPTLAESLDPDRTRWDPVPPIPAHLFRNCCLGSNIVDGKLITATEEDDNLFGAAFDPDTGEWAHAPLWWMDNVSLPWHSPHSPHAVVGGVPYVLRDRILGNGNDGQWRPVEGESVTKLLNRMIMDDVTMQNFGGLLCLEGEEEPELRDGFFVMFIFAGIDISRTADGGFKGSIMWLDSSLKLSEDEVLAQRVVLEL